ncbi:exodeoxyribonuclease VII large subunit [Aliiglaciecola sp. LCG003]|uniref:exodeoxyribonuclease VII large subunit n=1 Tax=Aliiglaciecola sp. LCG003 TaxID=3053655 RepID=UPI0025745CAF|nr:exodeoxyribonuclease VII large subunit [Aliiglaciecola sp. LCG003]WJG10524.1 exodeoxyribonuclease VII large subunit [Aliiglaciecola sp. LCG003]
MLSQSSNSKNIFTVSQLNRMARSVLESEIGQVWLSAEISNFVAASSGHWYFTLKDSRAQVKAAMFRGANSRIKLRPKEGDKILVRATIGIYEARGDYQLVVDFMEPEGEGQLKQQFEMLKIKLSAEGLFSTHTKQSLPSVINSVGVITSATGAALHDILTVLKRRNPAINVIVYPSQVQGELAPALICQALDKAIQRNEVDVLIVGRGGGSLEDLWCFNDEAVARKIFICPIPIISAVGHEVDVTIADFVADLRAPTPSAAAEMVSSDQIDVLQSIVAQQKRLSQSILRHIQGYGHHTQLMAQKLKLTHPENRIRQQYQHLDTLRMTLEHRFNRQQSNLQQRLASASQRLDKQSPANIVNQHVRTTQNLQERLSKATHTLLNQRQLQLAKASQLLDTVSPLSTLSRGYSITFKDNQIVKSSKELQAGDQISSKFHDGEVTSQVIKHP